MYSLVSQLYPICRSITGRGLRQTLKAIQEILPLEIKEVPSGTAVFDWKVPREWNIRGAYIKGPDGKKIADFEKHNLHIVSYSIPVKAKVTLQELKDHLHSSPGNPDHIPYRTTYYKENWGFCLAHKEYESLKEGQYEVFIDSALTDGHMTYGEFFIPGRLDDEVLVSTHICHPSLCNDNLSGTAVAVFLAEHLSRNERRYSYRFLFLPGTIGAIAWLALNRERTARIKHGLVLAGLGDSGGFTYKKSRRTDAEIDRTVQVVLRDNAERYTVREFSPFGYDERQYCSPGFDLPVGCVMRSEHGTYPEYHTSADDLSFIGPESLRESLDLLIHITKAIETNRRYLNLNPHCEPQLGRRGLYGQTGGSGGMGKELAYLWVLNLSDGRNSLLDIAERSGLSFSALHDAATSLLDAGLLRELDADA